MRLLNFTSGRKMAERAIPRHEIIDTVNPAIITKRIIGALTWVWVM